LSDDREVEQKSYGYTLRRMLEGIIGSTDNNLRDLRLLPAW
jgi:hypothetical protein